MLPPYIIEDLRRREEARKEEEARPQPWLELERPVSPRRRPESEPESDRGVTIIQVG